MKGGVAFLALVGGFWVGTAFGHWIAEGFSVHGRAAFAIVAIAGILSGLGWLSAAASWMDAKGKP